MYPSYITQVPGKPHAGLTLPLAVVAEVKLACVCISAVVMPLPPPSWVIDVSLFQKLVVTVPVPMSPTSAPLLVPAPLTLPVE